MNTRPDDAPTTHLASELLDVVDELSEIRRLTQAAWMASNHMEDKEERDGMQVVIVSVLNKITAAHLRLDAARKAA